MKPCYETYVSDIQRKRMQRRRFVSLLLVLSMFVTSGVSWALRGVGITMVNEAECGEEEHIHTDECYEQQLICGLEEDGTHVHTDACYENVLVCGKEEHIHSADCFAESDANLFSVQNISLEDARNDAAGIAVYDDTDLADDDGGDGDDAPVMLRASPDGPTRAEGDSSQVPGTVETVDNIARGIKFTLFDYGDSTLESKNNHYGYWYNSDTNAYEHPSVNTTDGINAGRNIRDDILFFAYGTPPPHGAATGNFLVSTKSEPYTDNNGNTVQPGDYIDTEGNKVDEEHKVPTYQHGEHDKNSYTGDYNADSYQSGNRPYQGIVYRELVDGYPAIKVNNGTPDGTPGNSLAYLFNPSESFDGADKRVTYSDVNHLLQEQNGHLVYNSNENYAYYNQDTGNFDVYSTTYEVVNDAHHWAGDKNNIRYDANQQQIVYPTNVDPGFKIGFFPFDPYDENRKDPNFNGNGFNHHFGMTMEAKFKNLAVNTSNGAEPITFKYSGDDDMWVFVDGKLVLDIGGIHEPAGGMIDFTNNLVWVQDNSDGKTFEQLKQEGNYTDAAWNALPKPISLNTGTTSGSSENKWLLKTITDYIPEWNSSTLNPDGTSYVNGQHEIKMFYLERGGCYSNLAMEMNLPTVKPLDIVKKVDYKRHLVKNLYDDAEYEFWIYEWDTVTQQYVPTQNEHEDQWFYLPQTTFKLKDGERKTFDNVEQDRIFRIVEAGVDPNIYDKVYVNGVLTENVNGDVAVEGHTVEEINSYTFTNSIAEEFVDVTAKKEWDPPDKAVTDFDVKYRILRTDSVTGETKQVALKETDPVTGLPVKKRIFTVPSSVWASEGGVTKTDLLARYGNHYYTYKIEELNVPNGFKAAYSYSESEDGKTVIAQITNTDIRKMNLYVRKDWERAVPDDHRVQLRLTRKKIGYTESTPTLLQVNIEDEGGNPIKTYTTPAYVQNEPYKGVYANGSAELAYAIPEGAQLYWADQDYPRKSYTGSNGFLPIQTEGNNPDDGTLYVKFEEDENILCVHNLAPIDEEHPDVIPNVVTFKLKTDTAADSLLLLHHSFTRGTNGWTVQNDPSKGTHAKIMTSGANPYAKGDALLISERTKAFNGAMLYLDPAKFFVNKTYTFSTYVYSPVADRFKMTFNNGLPGGFIPISDYVDVPANTWTQITGTVQLTSELDPYNMFILVESEPVTVPVLDDQGNQVYDNQGQPVQDNEACRCAEFYMDEFTAIEGRTTVKVDQNTGTVRVGTVSSGGNLIVYQNDFTGSYSEWTVKDYNNSGTNVTAVHEVGENNSYEFYFIAVRNRGSEDGDESDGIQMNASMLEPGKTYHFEIDVQGDGNNGADHVQLSIDTYNQDPNEPDNPYSNFKPIQHITIRKNGNNFAPATMSLDYTIPSYSDKTNQVLYFETINGSGQHGGFRIHSITITDPTQQQSSSLEDLPGYDESTGQYVSDYSNYGIVLDEDSVTNPLRLLDTEYQTDYIEYIDEDNNVKWERTITLPDDGPAATPENPNAPWTYHWNNQNPADTAHYIAEEANFLYEYHLEEVWIDSAGNVIETVQTEGEADKLFSKDGNYLVTYTDNDVATNDPDTPIIVTNRYIWYKLPATGGVGADAFYGTGLLLTITGFIGGYALRKRERRFK